MSRVGNAPITVPQGVEVNVTSDSVKVKGPKGELEQAIDAEAVQVKLEEGVITLTRTSDVADHRSKHGLYRALINNMIEGVSNGFKKELEFIGVGYRATTKGQLLEMVIGYSHPVAIEIPSEIKVSAETEKGKAPVVTLESHDKQLVGQVAAKIRSLRKPEPYKGKGIKYKDEFIRRKAGKAAGK
ncbi:MAG: 50S ribosomal protein L6 [Crocinitomicaceae bacterium]|nr:50S ribosomal protein L6 [Crocinitomicaceae bacterium]